MSASSTASWNGILVVMLSGRPALSIGCLLCDSSSCTSAQQVHTFVGDDLLLGRLSEGLCGRCSSPNARILVFHIRRYLIWQHPEVEARLAAELNDAGLLVTPQRPAPRAMEYADLSRLNYLSWVCKVGSVRLHCSFLAARSLQDYQHEFVQRMSALLLSWDGWVMPASTGTRLMIPRSCAASDAGCCAAAGGDAGAPGGRHGVHALHQA